MNTYQYNHIVRAKFGPETRFTVQPAPLAPFRATQENAFEQLKKRLLTETLLKVARPELNVVIRRAANEAAALAWVTFVPLLLFPGLFEEKLRAALRQAARQARIYNPNRELVVAE